MHVLPSIIGQTIFFSSQYMVNLQYCPNLVQLRSSSYKKEQNLPIHAVSVNTGSKSSYGMFLGVCVCLSRLFDSSSLVLVEATDFSLTSLFLSVVSGTEVDSSGCLPNLANLSEHEIRFFSFSNSRTTFVVAAIIVESMYRTSDISCLYLTIG